MTPWTVLSAAGIGLGLGMVTGMPLGVVNVAIVDAATADRRRFALGLGLGGGLADASHAMLAFAGVGRVVTADPELVRLLAIGAAIAISAYAVVAWRGRRRGSGEASSADAPPPRVQLRHGLAAGCLLTLPNPAALAAWVAVAASVWPDASLALAAVIAAGVGGGSALWFGLLARWVARVRPDHPALAVIPRAALVLLVAIAAIGVVRAL